MQTKEKEMKRKGDDEEAEKRRKEEVNLTLNPLLTQTLNCLRALVLPAERGQSCGYVHVYVHIHMSMYVYVHIHMCMYIRPTFLFMRPTFLHMPRKLVLRVRTVHACSGPACVHRAHTRHT